jgi:uncharacterized protein YndB with AHSA1/START domain
MDLRVGGARVVCMEMQTPDGPMQMWFAGEFVEIVDHELLVSPRPWPMSMVRRSAPVTLVVRLTSRRCGSSSRRSTGERAW